MAADSIKKGSEVVSEFLASLEGNNAIDPDTLNTIRDLFHSGKLSKTQLLRALERRRENAVAQGSGTEEEKA